MTTTPPDKGVPSTPEPAPGWGQPPVPAGWGQPGWAAPSHSPAARPGSPVTAPAPQDAPPPGSWRPPALQPGIVPLRPLGLGEILDGAVRAIRDNPQVMFGLSAIVVAVTVVIGALLRLYLTPIVSTWLSGAVSGLGGSGAFDSETGATITDLYGSWVGQLAGMPLTALATTVLTGLLIVSVSRSVLGEQISGREAMRSGRVWWVVGFSLLAGTVEILALGVWAGLAVWLAFLKEWVALGLVVILGGIALSVGGVWFAIRTVLVAPALMLEGSRFWTTIARAWRLTRGSFWRLLVICLLTSIMVGFVVYAITLPANYVGLFTNDLAGTGPISVAATSISMAIALTLSTTYLAAVVALLYIDVRMRREGLDLDLAQAAAGRAK
jgi:uncharacterized protein (DUF486 family)